MKRMRIHCTMLIFALAVSLLAAGFCFGSLNGCETAFAASKSAHVPEKSAHASKMKLSRSSITLTAGGTAKLRVKKASKKVRWTSSNKRIVTVSKPSGKYRQKVLLRAADQPGSCVIRAKVGKKTLKCRVTVTGSSAYPSPPEIEILPLSGSSADLSADMDFHPATDTETSAAFDLAYKDFSFRLLQAQLRTETAGGSVPSAAASGDLGDRQLHGTQDQPLSAAGAGNLLISPDSVMTALTMTANGASGSTLQQMRKTLAGDLPLKDLNENLLRMHTRLGNAKDLIYTTGNSIWSRRDRIKVAPAFLKKNKAYHNASFYEAPFDDETVSDINRWVYNHTRNMIDEIIDPRAGLSDDARMLLINTVAFEGSWMQRLKVLSGNNDRIFTLADGSKRTVSMLGGTTDTYLTLAGGRGFCTSYAGGSVAFLGLLPPEGMSARDYAEKLSGKDFAAAWKERAHPEVVFRLPAFRYDYSSSVRDALADMGMPLAFTGDADFSGMMDPEYPRLLQGLNIDDVLHKTHIELDENGTKAAAVTAVIVEKSTAVMDPPPREYVYLDRPFVYGLVDTKTGNPLFLGILEEPAAAGN